jgi:hypothetical protein
MGIESSTNGYGGQVHIDTRIILPNLFPQLSIFFRLR